ncbi:MAG: hypothetical protein HKN26_01075 [Acidimicrobiales bacterium]|nr:hypothetical protein [Acidimicrobiales bacterium]
MSRTDAKTAWANVGDELEALGLKLKLHIEQEFEHDEEVESAFERLAEAIDAAADTTSHVVHDEAIRDDLKTTGRLVVDALATTLRQTTDQLRNRASGG